MAKNGQSKLFFWLKVALIGFSVSLSSSHPSWAKSCAQTEIHSEIEEFKNPKKANAALDAVVQCGKEAISPLEQALSENEVAIRVQSASALGKMGVTAQDAAPALVAVLGDSDETVRTKAASALIQIGRAVQKQEDVSWDVEAVQKLKTFQQNLVKARKQLEADK